MTEDFNGIYKCAMCGGDPIFRIRFSSCYCKCTICGNGFEVYKGDFETNPANKSDKRLELISMWNAKQDVNVKLMRANDWTQESVIGSKLETHITDKVDEAIAAVNELAEQVYLNHEALTQAIENMVVVEEVPVEPEPAEDPAQTKIEDYQTEAPVKITATIVEKDGTVTEKVINSTSTTVSAPEPIEINPDVPEPAPAEDRFAAAIAAANASIAATPKKNLEVVSPVENIPVEQLIDVMKEEPVKEEVPEFIIEPTECKPETEVLAIYAECENLAEGSAKKDVPVEVEEILKVAEEKPIEQAIEEKKLPDERDAETRSEAYRAASNVALGLHTDATPEEAREAFTEVLEESKKPLPEEFEEAAKEKIEETPAVFEETPVKEEKPSVAQTLDSLTPEDVQMLLAFLKSKQ